MATDRSRTAYQAFLVQDSAWGPDALASDSSFTGISPLPGQPQPADSSQAMALAASGTFATPSATLTVTTQQGGIVARDRGAAFRWSDGTNSYGWDAPTVITGWESIVWSTSNTVNHPTVISLQSGTLLACWARGALADSVYSSSKPVGGTWSTAAIVGSGLWSKENTPCLLQLNTGRVLLFGWASEDASTATVRKIGRAHV